MPLLYLGRGGGEDGRTELLQVCQQIMLLHVRVDNADRIKFLEANSDDLQNIRV